MHNSGNTPDTQLPIPVDVLPAASRFGRPEVSVRRDHRTAASGPRRSVWPLSPRSICPVKCEIPVQVAESPVTETGFCVNFYGFVVAGQTSGQTQAESARDYATAPASLLSRTTLKAVAGEGEQQPTRARPR